jgi:integrase/recombinase XerD
VGSLTATETVLDINGDMELIKAFQEDAKLRGMSSGASPQYGSLLKIFARFVHSKGYGLLNADRTILKDYIGYLKEEKKAQSTIRKNFAVLSVFYDFLVYEGHLKSNVVHEVRKRYLQTYKSDVASQTRQIISIDQMSMLINSVIDTRDKAIITLLAKTGMRRGELLALDIDDLNLGEMTIVLKPTPKRSNKIMFFDHEAAAILKKWLKARELYSKKKSNGLFITQNGDRLHRVRVNEIVRDAAIRVGLHDLKSDKLENHFGLHCCRHWFTTHLIRAGMPRDFVKELRGDARHDAIDIYNHIDKKELRESYLAHIPQLGI